MTRGEVDVDRTAAFFFPFEDASIFFLANAVIGVFPPRGERTDLGKPLGGLGDAFEPRGDLEKLLGDEGAYLRSSR